MKSKKRKLIITSDFDNYNPWLKGACMGALIGFVLILFQCLFIALDENFDSTILIIATPFIAMISGAIFGILFIKKI